MFHNSHMYLLTVAPAVIVVCYGGGGERQSRLPSYVCRGGRQQPSDGVGDEVIGSHQA